MGLLSFLQRPTDAPTATDSRSVEDIRRRVRRRLIGAAALVMVAVVALPLMFDAAPRPVAVDIAIEIPSRDAVAPLPAPRAASAAVSAPVATAVPRAATQAPSPVDVPASPAPARKAGPESATILTETAADAGREVAPLAGAASSTPAAVRAAAASAAAQGRGLPSTASATPEKPKAEAAKAEAPKADGARTESKAADGRAAAPADKRADPGPRDKSAASLEAARALAALEARPLPATEPSASAPAAVAPPEAASRFVVQVGAFSEPGPLREARQKVEKLGLKTYTQVVETASGPRTRVRVGPFGDRGEADRAAAQIRQSGLAPVVLSL